MLKMLTPVGPAMLVLILAACGGGDSEPADAVPATEAAAPAAAPPAPEPTPAAAADTSAAPAERDQPAATEDHSEHSPAEHEAATRPPS